MTNESQIITDLQPFIEQITAAPLPSLPNAGSRFYLQIQQIRVEAVSQICCSLLVRAQRRSGDDAAEALRLALDSIRLELLQKFPDLAELLDPATWPNLRRH